MRKYRIIETITTSGNGYFEKVAYRVEIKRRFFCYKYWEPLNNFIYSSRKEARQSIPTPKP